MENEEDKIPFDINELFGQFIRGSKSEVTGRKVCQAGQAKGPRSRPCHCIEANSYEDVFVLSVLSQTGVEIEYKDCISSLGLPKQ